MATLISLVLAASTALAPVAPAQPADPILVTKVSEPDRAAALKHWTPERMRANGADSTDRAERVAKPSTGAAPKGVGRLLITEQPGGDTWCTATAVARDVVITAAHCVWPGTDRWEQPIRARDIVFAPSYDQGSTPLGVFPARAFVLAKSYTEQSSPDVAFVVLDPVDGKHIGDRAGTQRVSFDPPARLATTIFGYPGSRAGLGQRLFRCEVTATRNYQWNTPCDMAGGSSGGPWFTGFEARTGKGTIYSVTSKGTLAEDPATGELYTTELEGTLLSPGDRGLLTRAEQL